MNTYGNCVMCGAPMYVPSVWHGIIPPRPTYTCSCFSRTTITVTTAPKTTTAPVQIPVAQTERELVTLLADYAGETTSESAVETLGRLLEELEGYRAVLRDKIAEFVWTCEYENLPVSAEVFAHLNDKDYGHVPGAIIEKVIREVTGAGAGSAE